jgi:hypothetical protein
MTGLPLANARLTKVAGGGASEDFDQPAGAAAAKWSGDEDAYLVEKLVNSVTPQGLDQLRQDYLVIPAGLAGNVTTDDQVTYLRASDNVTATRKVKQIENHPVAGTCRLYLWDA